LNVINKGNDGILISGTINDILGVTTISNDNTSATAGITLTSSGRITNNNGNILVNNVGKQGIIVEGIIKTIAQNIIMNNSDSDVLIGDSSANNFYVDAQNGDIKITQVNGNILNSGVDKTLIRANGKLNLDVTDGNIGSVVFTAPANIGLGINADTRDVRESVNVNISDTITARAIQTDKTTAQSRLINLRSKNSDMKVNQIKADGNVILSATDWKQADQNPTPNDENYFRGYSILNASADSSKANIEGYNISMLSSNNIGEKSNWLTYNQYSGDAVTSAGYLSAEAENDLYLRGLSDDYDTNIWQLISKRGNMGLELPGDSIIREITANKNLSIVNRGKNLTIYDLGRLPHILNPADDVLYPHDRIALSDVVPETLNLTVLDINPRTRVNPLLADSTLNIFNAFVRGRGLSEKIDGIDTPVADIVLRADNVIANAYGAPSSPVSTLQNPSGFDGSAGRTYADNPLDLTAPKNLEATGFNSSGNGSRLVFDLRGVSPDLVSSIGRNINERKYYKPACYQNNRNLLQPALYSGY
jgi:hypothetical protein